MREILTRLKRSLTCALAGIMIFSSVIPAYADCLPYDYAITEKHSDNMYYGDGGKFSTADPYVADNGTLVLPFFRNNFLPDTVSGEGWTTHQNIEAHNNNTYKGFARALYFAQNCMASKDIQITSVSSWSRSSVYSKWEDSASSSESYLSYGHSWNPYYQDGSGKERAEAEFNLFVNDLKSLQWTEFNEAIDYVLANNYDDIWQSYDGGNVLYCYCVINPFTELVFNRLIETNVIEARTGSPRYAIKQSTLNGNSSSFDFLDYPGMTDMTVDMYSADPFVGSKYYSTDSYGYDGVYSQDAFNARDGHNMTNTVSCTELFYDEYEFTNSGANRTITLSFGIVNYSETSSSGTLNHLDTDTSKYITVTFPILSPVYVPTSTTMLNSAFLTDLQVGDILAPNSVIYKGYDPQDDIIWDCAIFSSSMEPMTVYADAWDIRMTLPDNTVVTSNMGQYKFTSDNIDEWSNATFELETSYYDEDWNFHERYNLLEYNSFDDTNSYIYFTDTTSGLPVIFKLYGSEYGDYSEGKIDDVIYYKAADAENPYAKSYIQPVDYCVYAGSDFYMHESPIEEDSNGNHYIESEFKLDSSPKSSASTFATRMPVEDDVTGYQIIEITEGDVQDWGDNIPGYASFEGVKTIYIRVAPLGGSHTVTFNSNGGSSVDNQTVSDGETATEPDPAPTKDYQDFEYWYLDDEDTAFDFSTPITTDITLNALWSGEMTYQKKLIQDGTNLSFTWNDDIDDVKTAFTTESGAGNTAATFEAEYEDKNTVWTASMTINDADYDEATENVPEDQLPNVSETKNLAVFDISIKKTIADDANETNILKSKDMTHTGSPLSISIDMASVLPDNAVLSDVSIYRIHNNAVTEVDVNYNESDMTATFENDDYSYFLMYYGWFHEVTFNSKGGTAVDPQTVADEGVATKPTPNPTKTGHTFSKWCSDTNATIEYDFTTPITADKTLYAAWTLNQYTVTFVTNGGTAIDPITVNYGQAFEIAPNSTTREGYSLLNWCTDEGLENVYDFTTPVTDDLILYANWNERNYTVKFVTLGGSSVDDQTVSYTGKATKPADPTRTGYTFDKWYLYGGDTPLGDGSYELSGPFDFSNAITPYIDHMYNTVTLYAGWNKNNYTVSFESNGGTPIASQHVDYLGKATKPADPTKTGHTFSKWYSNIGLTDEFDFNTPIEDNTTLYAGYTVNQYTVTFDSKGGSTVPSQTVNYLGKATRPTDPTLTGNAFDKWYSDEDCTQEFSFDTEITDDKILYAGWQLNKYSVTFVSNGGTAVDSQLKDHGSKADKPADPTKTGHAFVRWCSDEGLTTEYNFDTPLESNIILYADWSLNNYTITFESNGGTPIDAQHVDHGSYVTRPTDPLLTGHTFRKWYTDEGLTTEYDFTASVSSAMTLYAGYDTNRYTVTFNSNGGSAVASQSIEYENYATKPTDPSYAHYNFVRWYLNDEDTEFDFANTKITDDITLTAKWTLVKHTVTFDSNGGTDVASQSVEYGSSATRPSDPTQTSRDFVRWYLNDPTQEYDFSTPVTQDITLTALWHGEMVYQKRLTKNTNLGITWDDTMDNVKEAFHTDIDDEYADTNNYWTATMTVSDVPYEEAVSDHTRELPSEEDHKHSVAFDIGIDKKISTDAEATDILEQETLTHTQSSLTVSIDMNTVIADTFGNSDAGTASNNASNVRISDVEVYRIHNDVVTKLDVEYDRTTNKATFENDDYSIFIMYYGWYYEITFDSNGGSTVAGQLVHEGDTVTKPADPTKTDFVFDHWCSDPGLTTEYNFSTAVFADMTLYAKWKPLYTVTFDSVGGSAVAPQAVPEGDTATIPTSPTKALYVFDGWYKEASYVTLYDFTDPVTSSFTLYAKWKDAPITHTVTFDSDGGTAYPAQTVADGDKATNPGSPSKSGYTFVAWTMGGSNYDFTAPVTADITLKAIYKKNPEPTPEPEPDPEPSVEVPKFMYTEAKVNGQKFAVAGTGEITIIDTVNYSGYCNPAYDYTLEGILMNKATGQPYLDANGNEVKSVVSFHGSTEGTITVKFTFNASNIKAGTTLVVFEELRAPDGGLIAQHKDINSEAQSIMIMGYVPVQTGIFPWFKGLFK